MSSRLHPRSSALRICAAVALSAALCAGCKKKEAAAQPTPPLPVLANAATTMDFPVFISTFGSLAASNSVDIKAQVGGQLVEARFVEGQEVKAGDVLFVIDKAPFKASLEKAKGDLKIDEAGLDYAQFMVDKNKDLALKTVLAEQSFKKYLTEADAERGRILSDTAAIDTAKINLGYCEIVSPITGLTGKRLVDPGNIVSTSSNPTLVNVRSLDPIYADFSVPEKYFPKVTELLAKGNLKILARPQGDENDYEGTVTLIDNSIDASSGTIPLRATLANKGRKLWPGQFVTVKVILEVLKDVIVVPASAIQTGKDGAFVYVMRDGKADYVPVVIGQSDADRTSVLKGDLKAGEKVITVSSVLIRPGAPVMEAQMAQALLAQKMAAAAAAKQPAQGAAKPEGAATKPSEGKAKEQGK